MLKVNYNTFDWFVLAGMVVLAFATVLSAVFLPAYIALIGFMLSITLATAVVVHIIRSIQKENLKREKHDAFVQKQFSELQNCFKSLDTIAKVNGDQIGANSDQIKMDAYQGKIDYSQIEALFSLFAIFKYRAPLPSFRGWAISPDLAKIIVQLILANRPKVILSLGSGVSDVIIGYCLEHLGAGRLISIEHDIYYEENTRSLLDQHALDEYVELHACPLIEYEIHEQRCHWYGVDMNEFRSGIDMLIVDGPPGSTELLARYPALPLLRQYLNENCVIVVDDGKRDDERSMMQRWKEEFDLAHVEYLNTEKGTYLFRI